MKFDVVVGNPPYQNPGKSRGEKLWYRFVQKSFDLLNNKGYLGYITPNSWLSGGVNLSSGKWGVFKDIFKKYQLIVAEISGITDKYFKGIGVDIGYFICQKTKIKSKSKIKINNQVTLLDMRKIEMISPEPNLLSIKIVEKVLNDKYDHYDVKYFQKSTKPGELAEYDDKDDTHIHPHWVMGDKKHNNLIIKYIDFKKSAEIEYPKIMFHVGTRFWQPFFDKHGIGALCQGYALAIDDDSSYESFISIFHSKLFVYICKKIQIDRNGFMKTSMVRKLPKLDMTKIWTDREIYEHFGLTEEEIAYIEETLR